MAVATARGAFAGALGGLVFGTAHLLFIKPVLPPYIVGVSAGALCGAVGGLALARSGRALTMPSAALALASPALPLLVANLASRAWADPPWLAPTTLVLCVLLGLLAGQWLAPRWRGPLAIGSVGAVVGALGEPFVHEGAKPRILAFLIGLVLALAIAGAALAHLGRRTPE